MQRTSHLIAVQLLCLQLHTHVNIGQGPGHHLEYSSTKGQLQKVLIFMQCSLYGAAFKEVGPEGYGQVVDWAW